jgi:hypothetical protein
MFIQRDSRTEALEQQWDSDITQHYAQATQLALLIADAKP